MIIRKKSGLLLEIQPPAGEPFDIATSDLVAAIASAVGPQHWVEDLMTAHLKLTHTLYKQNAGVIGTDSYNPDNPEEGDRMEELCGEILTKMIELRDSDQASTV